MGEIEDFIIKAKQKLKASKLLYEQGFYGDSVSSSYYVMMLVVKALLLKKGEKPKKHSGTIKRFNKLYVHEDGFDYSIYIDFVRTQTLRHQVDYDSTDDISQKVAKYKLSLAERFIKEGEKFL